MGRVLTDARTVLLEHTVTSVGNLQHHLKMKCHFTHHIISLLYVSCRSKLAKLVNMAKTVRFNVRQIAMDHVDILMDHVQFVREAGMVTIAVKVITNHNDIRYLNINIFNLLISELYH